MKISHWLRRFSSDRFVRNNRRPATRRRKSYYSIDALEQRVMLSGTPVLVKDVNPGTQGGFGYNFLGSANGELVFEAYHPVYGNELWKSDGTEAGTVLLKDIQPGLEGTIPRYFTDVNGSTYFAATTNDGSWEYGTLWKTDGTSSGTVQVKSLFLDSNGFAWIYPESFVDVNGMLFFVSSDGFVGNEQLWKSDGTEEGTTVVMEIWGVPAFLTNVGGTLYFNVSDGVNGGELWKSDGTESGTSMVADINPMAWSSHSSIGSSSPNNLTDVNGTLYFTADDGSNGRELWKSDGTETGTVLVKNIVSGSGSSNPQNLTNVGGTLYFTTSDGANGVELWKSDGTEAGTVLVKDIVSGSGGSNPAKLTDVNGVLYFTANNGTSGIELWKSDGTEAGTVLVKDIATGSGGSNPLNLTNVNGVLYFSADNGADGRELWKSDGTEAGTEMVMNILDGASGSTPEAFTLVGNTLFFTADDGVHGRELWKLNLASEPTPETLADVISELPPETTVVQATATTETLETWVAAVEVLPPRAAEDPVIDIVLNLESGDYNLEAEVNVPLGYQLIINGESGTVTFSGNSPALTVASGTVIVYNGANFINSTDAPTILVTGGKLIIRDSRIVETTGGEQAAIEILGGTVDLGTASDPGGNTIVIHGTGDFIRNTGANAVSAIGNTFEIDTGSSVATLTSFDIEDEIFHALDAGGGGLVTYAAGNVFVTADSGSIQRGVDAVAVGGQVNVEGASYAAFDAGAKLVTVAFAGGASIAQVTDEFDSSLRSVVVTGTDQADRIVFRPGNSAGAIKVDVNNLPTGTFAPTGRLVAYGGAGDDDIEAAGTISLAAWFDGGAGDDRIKGGAGHDSIFGGEGDDLLVGGGGRDLIVGGSGADRIVGNADDDILIAGILGFAGSFSFGDSSFAASVDALMSEWTSERNYATRVANISGVGSGPRNNGDNFLVVDGPSTTVFDDAAKDTLTGSAGTDWFLSNLTDGVLDKITDLLDSEFAADLEWILAEPV